MPALTPARLPRSTTDRLLDGGVGPEPLRQLLAAAAAPAQADELGGERAAHRAFITAARFPPLIGAAPHNPRRHNRALSWIVAAKAIAAVALTAGAGGVAVAATSGSFPDGLPAVSIHQKSDPDPDSARPTVPSEDGPERVRVLIVDDSGPFRGAARRLLERRGYKVVGEADSAAAGFNAVERLRPDVVLLDVHLPDGSGLDLCALLTRDDDAPAVLLVSGNGHLDSNHAKARGARDLVAKTELAHVDLARIWA